MKNINKYIKLFNYCTITTIIVLILMLFVVQNSKAEEMTKDLGGQAGKYAEEIMNIHLKEIREAEEGKKLFEEFLKKNKMKIKYGSKEYWERLIELSDISGELRMRDPEKWQKIYEYAYKYSLEFSEDIERYTKNNKESIITTAGPKIDIGGGNGSSNGYNRNGAVNYAYDYVYKYNKKYHKFSADCTNFVSQCLSEGGGIKIVDGILTPWFDPEDWYYNKNGSDEYDKNNDDSWSWSWVKVEYLYKHLVKERKIAEEVSSIDKLQIGDIVQMDMAGSGDYNHSMIVTKIENKDNKIDVYLTYHTIDRKDMSLTKIKTQSPKAQFRYIHIK